jgi:Ca-activated chloride channel homolog
MTFVWPQGLLGYMLVAALAGAYVWATRRRARASISYPGVELLARAAAAGRPWRRHLPVAFYLLTLCAMVLALARPVWSVPVPDNQAAVMLSIDVSGSMISTDVYPSRIEAAKRAAIAFVRALPAGAKVGLVKFSTTATLVAPATADHERVVAALAELEPEASTAIGDGLLVAVYALPGRDLFDPSRPDAPATGNVSATSRDPARLPPAAVVLMTDGGNNTGSSPEDAAATAKRLRVTVHTVGFGKPGGPDTPVGDPFALDEDLLKRLAAAGGGTYHRASTAAELAGVYGHLVRAVAWKTRPEEVGGLVSGASAFLFGGTMLLSLLWRRLD